MTDAQQHEYNELKKRDDARKERARTQGARNRARMAFYKKFFDKTAKPEDKKALQDAIAQI